MGTAIAVVIALIAGVAATLTAQRWRASRTSSVPHYAALPIQHRTIDEALGSHTRLPIEYASVQGLLTRMDPTADQIELPHTAIALCRAAFISGMDIAQDMRSVYDQFGRFNHAAGLFREYPNLTVLKRVNDERGKMARIKLGNGVEEHTLECWAEWRSTSLGAPVVVLILTHSEQPTD